VLCLRHFYPSAAKLSTVELCVYVDGTLIIPALAAFVAPDWFVLIVPITFVIEESEYATAVIESPEVVTLIEFAAWLRATSLTTEVVTVPDSERESLR
jgi:hypothetical protein